MRNGACNRLMSIRKGRLALMNVRNIVSMAFCLIAMAGHSVEATERFSTNEAKIPVDDQTQATQKRALKAAFTQVLVKMSGMSTVIDNAGVRSALSTPDAYLRSYRFSYENNQPFYIAEFDRKKITTLLQKEQLPLWGDRRPETLIWLAVEDENEVRTILDESTQNDIMLSLNETARKRGVPISIPLMDLTDSVTISIYDVWGRFVEPLSTASSRYLVDNIIGARLYKNVPGTIPDIESGEVTTVDTAISEQTEVVNEFAQNTPVGGDVHPLDDMGIDDAQEDNADNAQTPAKVAPFSVEEFSDYAQRAEAGDYALDWVFIGNGKVSYGSIYDNDPATLAKKLVDAYGNYLSSLYAVVAGASNADKVSISISVSNINSIDSYAKATEYLNSLSVVDSAMLTSQSGSVATFDVTLFGTTEDLLNTVRLSAHLKPVTDAYGQIVEQKTFYWNQ